MLMHIQLRGYDNQPKYFKTSHPFYSRFIDRNTQVIKLLDFKHFLERRFILKTHKIVVISLLALTMLMPLVSYANETQTLATCLTDSLNGKERKSLIKWVFFAMSAHPELDQYTQETGEDVTSSNETMGALVTRLFTEDCPEEAVLANKTDPLAIQKAFEFVGQVAMQELMRDQNVMSSISNYVQHTDQNKINALFVE